MIFAVGCCVAAGAGVGPAVGRADPPPACSFTLSEPEVVADTVVATVAPAGCAGVYRPRISVVCLQGPDPRTQCSQGRDADPAQVSVPYRPGATYTSTGRGLGTVFDLASDRNWQLLGPFTAVL